MPLHFFGGKSTISRYGELFGDAQYSLVSFLFAVLLLTVPPYPTICKSGGGHVPHGVGTTDCRLYEASEFRPPDRPGHRCGHGPDHRCH